MLFMSAARAPRCRAQYDVLVIRQFVTHLVSQFCTMSYSCILALLAILAILVIVILVVLVSAVVLGGSS